MTGGTRDMLARIDEIFGPLAVRYQFDSGEETIRTVNDTEYGLAGYLWSSNPSRAWPSSRSPECWHDGNE